MQIQEITFGPKQYLTLRKSIAASQITDMAMYDAAGKQLGEYMAKNNIKPSGHWSVLYFLWDEGNKKADIGIAFPVEEVKKINDSELTLVTLPETKAALTVLYGPYDNLGKTHQAMMKYAHEHKYTLPSGEVIAIEEYVISPKEDSNIENLETNIYYLHK